MDAVFRSKIDLWLLLLIVAVPIVALDFLLDGSGISDTGANLITALTVALVLCLFAWLYFTTRYTVTAETLFVKSGPYTWVISLREITSIEPTRSPASAPALSLDRLLIRYGGDRELIVSPADKRGFVAAIKKRVNR